jgi:hypothetical protein
MKVIGVQFLGSTIPGKSAAATASVFFHLTYATVANTFATVGPNSAGLGTP